MTSVSARMRPCRITANKLVFPHISKHGTPDLALINHIRPQKIDLPVYDRAKVQKCMGTKLHCVRKLMERNRDWLSVFNRVVPYKLSNAQN